MKKRQSQGLSCGAHWGVGQEAACQMWGEIHPLRVPVLILIHILRNAHWTTGGPEQRCLSDSLDVMQSWDNLDVYLWDLCLYSPCGSRICGLYEHTKDHLDMECTQSGRSSELMTTLLFIWLKLLGLAWWWTPVISELARLKQEGCKLETNLGYIVSGISISSKP